MPQTITPPDAVWEMIARAVPLLVSRKLDAFADLFAESAIFELPFAPPGAPRRIEGREAIRAYLTGGPVPLAFTGIKPLAHYQTDEPGTLIAEYDAYGHVEGTGRSFTTRYLWIVTVRDGAIVRWRDYWNPLEILELLDAAPDSAPARQAVEA